MGYVMFHTRKVVFTLGLLLLSPLQAIRSLATEDSATTAVDDAPTCDAPEKESAKSEVFTTVEQTSNTSEESKSTEGDLFVPELPDMTHGGIMVYFHLYKTGGSSITLLIKELKHWLEEEEEPEKGERVVLVNNREDMTEQDIRLSITMVKNKMKPVFYNFHVEFPATMYPTLVEAKPVLDEWRRRAAAEGVPFFAATVLREPLGHALSFFNFFHVAVDEQHWSPFTGNLEPTEENFLKTYVPNRLCHLIYDDAHGILEAPDFALREGLLEDLHHFMDEEELNRRNEPSFCDMEKVREILFEGETFDFVGITERLSTHILPMFSKIVFGDHTLAEDAEQKKKASDMNDEDVIPLRKQVLSVSTKEMVARESAKDQQLYEEARERFANWPSYL